jgi:hypothetical protein
LEQEVVPRKVVTSPGTTPYSDVLQLMRCSEAASACLRLFGFTDAKQSFSHAVQVIFGVSMLHSGNTAESRSIFEQQAMAYVHNVLEEACERYNLVRFGSTPKTQLLATFVQKGARSETTLTELLNNADQAKQQLRAGSSLGKSTGVIATPSTALAADIGPGQASTMRQAEAAARGAAISATPVRTTSSQFIFMRLKDLGVSDAELQSGDKSKNDGLFDIAMLSNRFNAKAGRSSSAVVCPAYAAAGDQIGKLQIKERHCVFGCHKGLHASMHSGGLLKKLSINEIRACWSSCSPQTLATMAGS